MVMIYAYFNYTQILSFENLGSVYMLASFLDPVQLLVACSTEFDFPVSKWEESGIKATYMAALQKQRLHYL